MHYIMEIRKVELLNEMKLNVCLYFIEHTQLFTVDVKQEIKQVIKHFDIILRNVSASNADPA